MKRTLLNITLLLISLLVLLSCQRKGLMDECICTDHVPFPISVDWTKSGVVPQNVTVLVYNDSDGKLAYEHCYEHNDKEIQSYINLPIGEYTIVVFNELRNQIDYVECIGHENFSTLSFEVRDSKALRSRTSTRSYVNQPGDLAIEVVKGVCVTKEMILENATKESSISEYVSKASGTKGDYLTRAVILKLLELTPSKKTSNFKILVHVKGLQNARMPALVDLTNMSDGYSVATDKNSKEPIVHQFTMNNRTYDAGSITEGTISTEITTFGTLGNRLNVSEHNSETAIVLDFLFMLVDKERTEVQRCVDITKLIKIATSNDGALTELSVIVDIAEALPDVKPEGSTDSGFSTEVEDWEGEDVNLKQ